MLITLLWGLDKVSLKCDREVMLEYSTIKEFIKNIENEWKIKIIDFWIENKYLVCLTDGDTFFIEDKNGNKRSFMRGGWRIKARIPI